MFQKEIIQIPVRTKTNRELTVEVEREKNPSSTVTKIFLTHYDKDKNVKYIIEIVFGDHRPWNMSDVNGDYKEIVSGVQMVELQKEITSYDRSLVGETTRG